MINRNGFKRVLDLGCGDATFLISLCKRSGSVTGYGVDISPEAIAEAHRKVEEAHLQGRVYLFTEDIFKLERTAASLQGIDAATAFFVFHEFLFNGSDRVVGFLRNFRELFPGVPLILFEAIRPTAEEMRKRPGPAIQYFLFHDLSKQEPVSREDWKALFSQAGFRSVSERYLGFARTGIYILS
jgi:cyclopropane fatty-acyl-phospholipid synthase-like methyltransferase